MRNLERLPEEELTKRAKELYGNKNPSLERIFVDEYGRFSYQKQYLIEQNQPNVAIFQIDFKALKNSEKKPFGGEKKEKQV